MGRSLGDAFLEDGAVRAEGVLNAGDLAKCREAFDWAIANPGPAAHTLYPGTDKEHHNDNANPRAAERLKALALALPFGDYLAELWGSEHVWYFAEEVFMKRGGVGGRTPWHQDTSYLPWGGDHWANAWISFEAVPKRNALEVVKGSHHGTLHDGTDFIDAVDPTAPLHGPESGLPQLPDIEARRKVDPEAYDILSWALEPGDALILHPGTLHGGAPVDADFRDRHTLVLRFFGDDAVFRPLPGKSKSRMPPQGLLFRKELAHLSDGEPFRAPMFQQLR